MPKIDTRVPAPSFPSPRFAGEWAAVHETDTTMFQGLGAIAKIIEKKADELRDVRNMNEYVELSTSGGAAIEEEYLRRIKERRPDHADFKDWAIKTAGAWSEKASDPKVKVQVLDSLRRTAANKTVSMIERAYAIEVDDAQAEIVEKQTAALHEIGKILLDPNRDPREIGRKVVEIEGQIAGLVSRGHMKAEEAAKLRLSFKQSVEQITVSTDIHIDPMEAARKLSTPGGYPDIKEDRRMQLLNLAQTTIKARAEMIDAQERRAERLQNKVYETNVAVGMRDILEGRITDPNQIIGQVGVKWKGEHAQELIRYLEKVKGEPIKDDPATLLVLADKMMAWSKKQAPTPEETTALQNEILGYGGGGKLNPKTAIGYVEKIQTRETAVERLPNYQRAVEMLRSICITKSEHSEEYNREQKQRWAAFHARLENAVRLGKEPYQVMRELSVEAITQAKQAEFAAIQKSWTASSAMAKFRPVYLPSGGPAMELEAIDRAIDMTVQEIEAKTYPQMEQAVIHLAMLRKLQRAYQTWFQTEKEIENLSGVAK